VHYALLKTALAQYRALAADPTLTRLPSFGKRSVHAGEGYVGVPALRRLLIALEDMAAVAALRPWRVQGWTLSLSLASSTFRRVTDLRPMALWVPDLPRAHHAVGAACAADRTNAGALALAANIRFPAHHCQHSAVQAVRVCNR